MVIQKANGVLKKLDDEHLRYKYELDFDQKLAQAYYSRGVNSEDKEGARKDFSQAIEHYQNVIDQEVTDQDKEDAMVKIGIIYQEMGENAQAVEQLQLALKQYPKSIEAYTKLGNLLLDIEQGKEEGSRNYSEAKLVYDQASHLDAITNDESYKKLTRRLQNLDVIQ